MLEKVTAENFQAHANLEITFDPKITVIVGPTDSGKSSVVRTLRWACLNQPRGSDFLRHGEDSLSVKVQIDGHIVERAKKKEANHYSLDDSNFTAFGTTIPETVSNFLSMDDLNFQQQHDAPFWLSLSAGEVSRQLNSIVDLEIIDKATATIKCKVLDQKRQIDRNMEKLRSENKKLEDLSWTVEAKSGLDHLQSVAESIESLAGETTTLRRNTVAIDNTNVQAASVLSKLNAIKSLGKQLQEILQKRADADKLKDRIEEIRKSIKITERGWVDVSSLESHILVCDKLRNKVSVLRKLLGDIDVQQHKTKTPIEEPALGKLIEEISAKSQQVLSFSNMLRAVKRAAARVGEAKQFSESAHADFEEVCVGSCPICGGEL
jgi:exonuclease SbcC